MGMLSIYQEFIIFVALFGAALSYRNRRGLVWLGALMLDYCFTTAYWRLGLPQPELLSGLCDAAVCVAIFFAGTYRWELRLWLIVQLCLFVNLLHLGDSLFEMHLADDDIYATLSEVLNALGIATIAGASYSELRNGSRSGRLYDPWAPRTGPIFSVLRQAAIDRKRVR